MSEDFICARCARVRKTCCQTSQIFVTLSDVARIEEATGETGFYDRRLPPDPSYEAQDDDSLWARKVFATDGTRRVLDRREDGDCVFLTETGCRLALETRPLVCRLYPFDYDEAGVREELSHRCPTELLAPGQGLLKVLDMTREQAQPWHTQLYAELREEPGP
jgi:uncharacterized protein